MLLSLSIKIKCINTLLTEIEPMFHCKFFGTTHLGRGQEFSHPVEKLNQYRLSYNIYCFTFYAS